MRDHSRLTRRTVEYRQYYVEISKKKKGLEANKYQDIPLLGCITIKYKQMGENAVMISIRNLRHS